MIELEKFYEYHSNDQRISKFDKIIFKLNKLLNDDPNSKENNDVSNIYGLNNTNHLNNTGYTNPY